MEDIHIKEIKQTFIQPRVDFCVATGECSIEGESFLEETGNFYEPLVDWLVSYLEIYRKINFSLKLYYFNTSTSKWILTILSKFKEKQKEGCDINVNWYFQEEDVDMRDDIISYMEDTGLCINLIPFQDL